VGLEYIQGLAEDYLFSCFHGGHIGCQCIFMQKDMIDPIKLFQKEIQLILEKPEHIAVHQMITGKLFGQYLYLHCSLDSN